jgi:hypothetical protein
MLPQLFVTMCAADMPLIHAKHQKELQHVLTCLSVVLIAVRYKMYDIMMIASYVYI